MAIVEAAHAVNLVGRLRRFAMGYELRIGMVEQLAVISVQGADSNTALSRAGMPLPAPQALSTARRADADVFTLRLRETAADGAWLVVPRAQAAPVLHKLDNTVDEKMMEAARIVYGFPRFGVDWDEHVHPLNANLVERRGVSFDKGCYVGQEVTSRMHWRKAVKRGLYRVRLRETPGPLPVDIRTAARVGVLSSLARSPDGQYLGIASLPVTIAEAGRELRAGDHSPVEILGPCPGLD